MTSGGFDPIHPGHVRLFNAAKKLGDILVVVINNDNWIRAKKGLPFMKDVERKEVIEGMRAVDKVMLTDHKPKPKSMSVLSSLKKIRPDIFANGGDRNKADAGKKNSSLNPEKDYCEKHGIKMVYNVGAGGKVQSSSWLLAKYVDQVKKKI